MDLLEFIDNSPTSFHAAALINKLAKATSFEGKIVKDKVYSIHQEGFVMLFKVPKKNFKKAVILAGHTDSPGLKLKPKPELVRDNLLLFACDVYGSPILSSWLNRDLTLAGRIIFEDSKGKVKEELVHLKNFILTVPQLALHLERDNKEGPQKINPQNHLNALVGYYDEKYKGKALEMIIKTDHSLKKIFSHDLFLVPHEKSQKTGLNGVFITAPRLDNLASCHAILEAFNKSTSPHLQIAIFWDHEEIGSSTATGADAPLFLDTLERICLALGLSREEYLTLKSRSSSYSVDLAHATHPSYQDIMEPLHAPQLGKGPVIKWSTTARYATTASSALPLLQSKVSIQNFIIRGDMKGGSTIGPIHAANTGIATSDLGIPQLSMHACRELIAEEDHINQIKLLKSLYNS